MPKLLTIFGVTGQQGNALARYILDTQPLRSLFTLRGVTRDMSKPAAVALKNEGVEIVEVSPRPNSNSQSGMFTCSSFRPI